MNVGKKKMQYNKKIDSFGTMDDINLEEYTDVLRMLNQYDNIKNPFNFRSWWNTLIAASDAPYAVLITLSRLELKYTRKLLLTFQEVINYGIITSKRQEIISRNTQFKTRDLRLLMSYTKEH